MLDLLSHTIFNNRRYTPKESSNFEFFNEFEWMYRMNEGVDITNFMIHISIDIQRLIFDYQNDCQYDNYTCNEVGTPRRLILFYECRTFPHRKILNGYLRVLDSS